LRIGIFVDECFWLGCPAHGNRPRYNGGWWREKIERNRRRDRDTALRLAEAGWIVIRAWKHEDPQAVAAAARCFHRDASSPSVSTATPPEDIRPAESFVHRIPQAPAARQASSWSTRWSR
jgi:DNA mismatch endonuclease (patch repair protein)